MRRAIQTDVALPELDEPLQAPAVDGKLYRDRFVRFIARSKEAGLDVAVIYADREHAANLAWLTGFDPRFEEALLIVRSGRDPLLLTGPENQGMARAAAVPLDVRLYPPFGLMGQERARTPDLGAVLAGAGIGAGMAVGVMGWKYFGAGEGFEPEGMLEMPSYLADAMRKLVGAGGRVVNAGALMMDPGRGLRARNEIDELARFEFAACHTSSAVKRVILGARPGMREHEMARLWQPIGLPLSCHAMLSSGERAALGLGSPSSRRAERCDPIMTAYGVWRALNCRAGFLAASADELPEPSRAYVERLVAPYYEAVVEWYETVGIGVPGGVLDAVIRRHLGDPFFGVGLNPGHLIQLDEWMHSPIVPGGAVPLASGMALQIDVIPATGGPLFTTNVEDGIALLDARGRAEFAERHPAAWRRIGARHAFMGDRLGIRLKPEVLPFSNIAGWLPPFWLAPGQAMAMR